MTDVANLDDLAGKIASGKYPNIANYAKAQAAATQSQELDIQQALAQPGVPGPPGPAGSGGLGVSVKAYGAKGDGSTDDRAAIQAAIDAIPAQGGVVYFPAGNYKVGSPGIDITGKHVTLHGERASSFSAAYGSVLTAGAGSMTLVNCNPTGLVQEGPQLESLTLRDGGNANVTLVYVYNTNCWAIQNCGFIQSGSGNSYALDTDHQEDNNWNRVIGCTFRTIGTPGVDTRMMRVQSGMYVYGCSFVGASANPDAILVEVRHSMSVMVTNCYFTGPLGSSGHLLKIGGSMCKVTDCVFEPTHGVGDLAAVEVVSDVQYQWGSRNTFIGNTVSGGTTGFHIGPSCDLTRLVANVGYPHTMCVDEGTKTLIWG